MTAISAESTGQPRSGVIARVGGELLVRRLGWIAAFSTLAALLLALLGFTDIVEGATALPVALLFIALAAVGGVAALAAHRAQATLLGRLDLFGQALEASPDAQLVLASDQSIAYANAALHGLFPDLTASPLAAIAERLEPSGRSQEEFQRLLAHVAAGRHAVAALSIREPGDVSGWFNVSVPPLAGRQGYSFWRLQDITARHEMEEVIRDEQNKLVDFLDNAPIGFYSVDGNGRFLFINETLASWLGGAPDEIIHSGARLQDFLAAEPPSGVPAHAP